MARYAPLPIVSIDPRNEAELVQAAAQRVYEASNRTLNDFSAGNPLAVLLEGQAFAQGEFLFWANQLPEKILIEWIGPFLGAMRRLGTPSATELLITIAPTSTATIIPAGSTFSTDSQVTGGVSIPFVSSESLTIPPGSAFGRIAAYSKFVGGSNNVPANSIVIASSQGALNYTVTNLQPATGGSDVETIQQVKERFFSLIRRPNPVSATDWQNFFVDLYGPNTLTSVQPNRSSVYGYNYQTDYVLPNGEVSFFVLGPNGVELTETQLKVGQNVVNFSVPIETRGHLYPITLSQVQFDLTVEVDANGTYGSSFRNSSLNFRDRLFTVLTPGTTFPADVNPTVSDVDAAFYSTFGSDSRFKDPLINKSAAYNTPNLLNKAAATYTQVYDFAPTGSLINENDLILVNNPNPTFYPAEAAFTPYSINKFDQTVYNNLNLKQIKLLAAGNFLQGDIVYYDGNQNIAEKGLHVVLENINVSSSADSITFIESGKISGVKTYDPWVVNSSYVYSNNGVVDPQIIEYDYLPDEFQPATPINVPLNQRPGALAWVVAQNFDLLPATNDITGAQAQFLLGSPVVPATLETGTSYSSDTWVCTPQVGSGPNAEIDPLYHYVDVKQGAIVKYAYVVSSFTYTPNNATTSEYFDSLVEQGILREIVVFSGDTGLPIYKYKGRFNAGQYLTYKTTADSEDSYYIAAKYFSPDSNDIQDLLTEELVFNLAPSLTLKKQLEAELGVGDAGRIATLEILDPGTSYVNGVYPDVPLESNFLGFDATATVTVTAGEVVDVLIQLPGQDYSVGEILTISNVYLGGTGQGVAIQVKSLVTNTSSTLKNFQRMFTFFAGDRTYFRDGNNVRSYTATSAVTPLFSFNIYLESGVFVETGAESSFLVPAESYIPFFDPEYTKTAEDTIISEDGKNLYRVTRAFTPPLTVTNWTGLEVNNTTRYEEYAKNLLRYVTKYSCEQEILPQSGKETSSIKLGVASITIIPKNSGRTVNSFPEVTYIWENTSSFEEAPSLSWYTSTPFPLSPPNYKNGTLAL